MQPAGLSGQSFDGPGHADRSDDLAGRGAYGCRNRCHAGFPLANRMGPATPADCRQGDRRVAAAAQPTLHAVRFLPGQQDLSRRARAHGQLGADRHTVTQSRHALRCGDTHPVVALPPEHLCRFPGNVSEPGQHRSRRRQQPVLASGRRQLPKPRAEDESALQIPAHQTMMLEGDSKAMRGRSGQPGRGHQASKGGRSRLQGAEHEGGFVEDADTARVVHALILPSRMLEGKCED